MFKKLNLFIIIISVVDAYKLDDFNNLTCNEVENNFTILGFKNKSI